MECQHDASDVYSIGTKKPVAHFGKVTIAVASKVFHILLIF